MEAEVQEDLDEKDQNLEKSKAEKYQLKQKRIHDRQHKTDKLEKIKLIKKNK